MGIQEPKKIYEAYDMSLSLSLWVTNSLCWNRLFCVFSLSSRCHSAEAATSFIPPSEGASRSLLICQVPV
ncbi:unnamed protein product [Victoria cruziana]